MPKKQTKEELVNYRQYNKLIGGFLVILSFILLIPENFKTTLAIILWGIGFIILFINLNKTKVTKGIKNKGVIKPN